MGVGGGWEDMGKNRSMGSGEGRTPRCQPGGGKNFYDDTDLLFLSGFPAWAKL